MFFDSGRFLVFVTVLYTAYRLLPERGRARAQNALLLAGSYFFYGSWNPRFVALLMLSTGIDFFVAQRIEAAHTRGDARFARRWLIASLSTSLGILGFFKYAGLWSGGLGWILRGVGVDLPPLLVGLVLPTGISFYTFQTMAYMIDVYRRKVPASRSLLDFALYVAFFPQLLAGPIERAKDLMPQLQATRTFAAERTPKAGASFCGDSSKKFSSPITSRLTCVGVSCSAERPRAQTRISAASRLSCASIATFPAIPIWPAAWPNSSA